MESSFFDDLLKRDVDQNAVNAIVGSLESHVTSGSSSGNNVTASSAQATNALSNDGHKSATAGVSDSQATNHIQTSSRPPSVNGSTSCSDSVTAIISQAKPASVSGSLTPNKQSQSPIISANVSSASSQVNIAPKNILSSTVPIAPRIMITPQQAQMLIEQRFAGTTLVPSNIMGNVRMAGAPVPLVPRMAGGPNAVTAVSGINMIAGQIPRMQNIVSRMQAPQPVILAQNIKQDPNTSTSHRTSPKPNTLAMQQQSQAVPSSVGLPSTTLTQVKGTSPVPGVVTYRFRQVNPGVTTANANANNLAVMKESVKKLKEFFQNLISLACGPNQPPDIGRSVKELVQNVMYNKMNEEEFVEKLQLTLKSDPQPNLVPFLKKTLPHLRETMKQQNKVQTSQPVQQTTKTQDGLQKVAPSVTQGQLPKAQISSTVNLANSQKLMPNAIQATVMQMNSNAQRQLTPSQQALLSRSIALQQRQQQLQKGIVQDERLISNPSGGKDIATVMKTNFQGNAAHAQGLVAGAHAEKSKHKAPFHYSSAMTSNDDDINDVTCMAGVNLMEESAKILSTGSELLGVQTRSCEDEAFLFTEPLKRKMESILKKHNLREPNKDVLSMVSHATEERLRNIIERLSVLSLHRVEAHKDHPSFEIVSDVKSQLRVFEQIDEVERKHREAREREMLMRVAKSRSRTEDPEQARLKEKAKQLQQEEEELLRKRAANKTALEAIGPRKKRKLDEALESLSTSYIADSGSSEGASASQLQPIRLRTRRITLKDLQFVLEQDKDSSKSTLVFKSYLR